MMRSLLRLSNNSRKQTRRRHVRRKLELQTLEEKKMMTVAACVLPTEPTAIVAQNLSNPVVANPAGGNPVAGDQSGGETGDQPGGNNSMQTPQTDEPIGTLIQLPTFAFTSVTTTVSVPDGGTILLGGIKRMSEGRVEPGVPLLSKIPYVSRLFHNVTIGRESSSLMLMVTPRIIIQEE